MEVYGISAGVGPLVALSILVLTSYTSGYQKRATLKLRIVAI